MRKLEVFLLGVAGLATLNEPTLAEGDSVKGKAAFAKCAMCHMVGPDAQNSVGPQLNAIVGRKAASEADYAKQYSPGMKKLGADGFVWTEEHIDKWIADPKSMLPESPMAQLFTGISNPEERADIIAYLKAFSHP
jgi:cytochrome c